MSTTNETTEADNVVLVNNVVIPAMFEKLASVGISPRGEGEALNFLTMSDHIANTVVAVGAAIEQHRSGGVKQAVDAVLGTPAPAKRTQASDTTKLAADYLSLPEVKEAALNVAKGGTK